MLWEKFIWKWASRIIYVNHFDELLGTWKFMQRCFSVFGFFRVRVRAFSIFFFFFFSFFSWSSRMLRAAGSFRFSGSLRDWGVARWISLERYFEVGTYILSVQSGNSRTRGIYCTSFSWSLTLLWDFIWNIVWWTVRNVETVGLMFTLRLWALELWVTTFVQMYWT